MARASSSVAIPLEHLARVRVPLPGQDPPARLRQQPDVPTHQPAPGAVPPPSENIHTSSLVERTFDDAD
jgi:hypothetical protein